MMSEEIITLEDLSLSLSDVEEIAKKYYKNKEFKVSEYQVKRLDGGPQGLWSSHYILLVTVKKENWEKTCSFFAKYLLQTEFGRQYSGDVELFSKECRIYQELIPRLQDVGIGHVPWAPRCFLMRSNRVLVLENLNETGFVSYGSRQLDIDHLKVALKTLARMHASSIALEKRMKSSLIDLYPSALKENGYPEKDGHRRRAIEGMTQTVIEFSKRIPGYTEQDHNEIIEAFPSVINRIYDLVKPSTILQNVMNESDLWANNFLFAYDDAKNPIDARLIDFQFSRYAPPTYDIASFLYTSTSQLFREKHKQELLDTYYEALNQDLAAYGFVIEDIIPRKLFNESYEDYKLAGLIENILFDQLIFLPQDFWKEISVSSEKLEAFLATANTEVCLVAFQKYPEYKEKMMELLVEIIDDYVLQDEWRTRL